MTINTTAAVSISGVAFMVSAQRLCVGVDEPAAGMTGRALQNGHSDGSGGCVKVSSASEVLLEKCSFAGCVAIREGGAVYVDARYGRLPNSTFSFSNCNFHNTTGGESQWQVRHVVAWGAGCGLCDGGSVGAVRGMCLEGGAVWAWS